MCDTCSMMCDCDYEYQQLLYVYIFFFFWFTFFGIYLKLEILDLFFDFRHASQKMLHTEIFIHQIYFDRHGVTHTVCIFREYICVRTHTPISQQQTIGLENLKFIVICGRCHHSSARVLSLFRFFFSSFFFEQSALYIFLHIPALVYLWPENYVSKL